MTPATSRRLSLLTCCLWLTACGQTGALYLPDAEVTTPVEIRKASEVTPAPTADAPAATGKTDGAGEQEKPPKAKDSGEATPGTGQ